MKAVKNFLAGLGGAVALNILHESLKKLHPDMPRIDRLGEEATQKGLEAIGSPIDNDIALYAATLGGDLISNATYYSAIGIGDTDNVWSKAIAVGLTAGMGAITLPEPMGLDPEPVAHSATTKALTVGYYLAGALVTACLVKAMSGKPASNFNRTI